MAQVTVIVPTYNSSATIEACLESILSQECDYPVDYLVVDSGTDGTDRLIRERFPSVRLIHLDQRKWPGAARNVGIRETHCEYLVFMDADCIAPSGWLAKLLERLIDEDRPVVGGSLLNAFPENKVAETEYLLEFNEFVPACAEGKLDFIPTAHIGYHSSVFEEHGLFMENPMLSADRLFNTNLTMKGVPLYFDPEIQVRHRHRRDFKKMLSHHWQLGFGSGNIRNKLPLPGMTLKKYPWLWPLLPWVRLARILSRSARYEGDYLVRLLKTLPWTAVTLYVWAHGFQRGLSSPFSTPGPEAE